MQVLYVISNFCLLTNYSISVILCHWHLKSKPLHLTPTLTSKVKILHWTGESLFKLTVGLCPIATGRQGKFKRRHFSPTLSTLYLRTKRLQHLLHVFVLAHGDAVQEKRLLKQFRMCALAENHKRIMWNSANFY